MSQIEKNNDGTAIFKLSTPITVNGEETSRTTIPVLRGKHMKLCPWLGGVEPTIGQLVAFAGEIMLPPGAVDEMSAADSIAAGFEVAARLQQKSAE